MVGQARRITPYLLGLALSLPAIVVVALVYWVYRRPLMLAFVPSLVISGYLGGLRGGLTATLVAVVGAIAVMPVVGSPSIADGLEATRVTLMATLGVVTAVLSERLLCATRDAKRSEDRLQLMFDASPVASSLTRLSDDVVLDVNEAYLTMWGVTRAQIVGCTAASAGILVKSSDDLAARIRAHGVRNEPVTCTLPTGEVRSGELCCSTIETEGETLALATFVDVTARRALEERLRENQKLESIGLLAGGIAHDFNNILGVIKTNAEMLHESLDAAHPDHELVDDINAGVARATGLTRQLLAFSRKQIVEPIALDVNETIQETRKLLTQLAGPDIAVRFAMGKDLPRVLCDPGQFAQMLMNLFVNARDAMNRSGTLWLETRRTRHGIEISVRDTGCGIRDEIRTRIFEPFFTTKGPGEGTGLGLSVVHGIVQDAGGTIQVESTVGVGSTFRIRLPAAGTEAPQPTEAGPSPQGRGVESILLVDDDPHIRSATARALRARGYTVHEASEGRMALALLEDHEVQLMVTDVVMPHMSGRVLADAAKVRLPELPVLFMSGYTDDEILRSGVLQTEVPFLEKPFRLDVLATKIRQLLDTRPAA